MVPSPIEGETVQGIILEGLADQDLEILDIFEESFYDKCEVTAVYCSSSIEARVLAYVWNHSSASQLLPETWCYEEHFLPSLPRYVRMCEHFMATDPDIQEIQARYKMPKEAAAEQKTNN